MITALYSRNYLLLPKPLNKKLHFTPTEARNL